MEKPVIYYQFDYEKFRKYHMERGYFSYKRDGFGKIIDNEKELIEEIKNKINVYELEDKYKERVNLFFDLKDSNNNKRTYEAIKELERN